MTTVQVVESTCRSLEMFVIPPIHMGLSTPGCSLVRLGSGCTPRGAQRILNRFGYVIS